jgi:hypothetical protein
MRFKNSDILTMCSWGLLVFPKSRCLTELRVQLQLALYKSKVCRLAPERSREVDIFHKDSRLSNGRVVRTCQMELCPCMLVSDLRYLSSLRRPLFPQFDEMSLFLCSRSTWISE